MPSRQPDHRDPHQRERLVAALRASGSVFAEEEFEALADAAPTAEDLRALVRRRVGGAPMHYLLGHVDFAGLRLHVAEGVFIPRPRTEFLAELALARLRPGGSLLDLGCGAAPVSAWVSSHRPDARVTAVDADPRALEVAARNLPGDAVLVRAASPAELAGVRFDVVAANLPYVPTGQIRLMPFEAREREPRSALDGGPDGLDPLRTWAAGVRDLLAPGGSFLTEVSRAQAATAEEILRGAVARASVRVHRDEEREATVVALHRPAEGPGAGMR